MLGNLEGYLHADILVLLGNLLYLSVPQAEGLD